MSFDRIALVAVTLLLPASAGAAPTSPAVVPNVPGAGSVDERIARPLSSVAHHTAASAGTSEPEGVRAVEREAVRWALARFEEARLELPAVEISFSTDAGDCDGEQGVYRQRSGEHFVVVCPPDREGAAIEHRRRRTLLHELAHAWEHATLTDADRTQLQGHFGAADWYSPARPWEDRPVEHLAETLTWGLLDQPRRPLLIDRACDDVHADFRAITGRAPIGPIEPVCETAAAGHRPIHRQAQTRRTSP